MNTKLKKRGGFALGLAICFTVAAFSVWLEKLIPGEVLGASIIALFTGTIINSFFHPKWIKPALKFTSKKILKGAIILLGASLSVNTIMSVGKMTFFVIIFTFAMCFGGGYFIRKIFGLNWKLSNLISAGTGICGGSAIAAIAPAIDAEDKDIAFAMSSTFIFDMIMVALYPIMGRALGMSDIAYGIWAGTSVNDTASVVASGYAFSEIAGDFATMVKLTRTLAIIPTVLVFAYIGTRIKQKELKEASKGQKVNIVKIIPWFIGGFLLLAILNSVGFIPAEVSAIIKSISKFLMVTALAAIGLGTSIIDFKNAGLRPMFYGITIDTLVTLTALGVIFCMGLM
ncbi:MAG: putative sulfate exporter family transporter [Clostridia bacterium]|nr:putative sulfate exporter family transporter [Clostridia bacterium]MBQ6613998.1 putative sulfate exporter family transporter [Clostridia bacterium]